MKCSSFNIILEIAFFSLIIFSIASVSANAQNNTVNEADVGILPSNPFYFLKEWSRGIQMFFAFNPIEKAELETDFADEKLNEALVLVEKEPENQKAIEKAFSNYQASQEKLAERLEAIKETSQNPNVDKLLTKVTEKVILHQTKLDELKTLKQEVLPMPALAPIAVLPKVVPKDTPEKFTQKIEQATEKLPYELKEIKAIEILDKVETQVPEPAKPAILQAKEKLEEKAIAKITESTSASILPKIQEIPVSSETKVKILENLETKVPKVIPPPSSTKLPVPSQAPSQVVEVIKEAINATKIEAYPQCGKIQCIRYDPVCGVDDKTYACGKADAEACGVKVAYEGECKKCIPRPACLDQEPRCLLPEPAEGWCQKE